MTTPPPTGWYPDPEDPSHERWFDSNTGQWLGETRDRPATGALGTAGPPPPPVKKSYRTPLIVGGIIVAILVIFGIVNATNRDDDTADTAANTSSTTAVATTMTSTTAAVETTIAPVPTTTPSTAAPNTASACDTAPSALVGIIGASFNDDAYTLGTPAFSVTAPGDLVYISADILKDGQRSSSQAVWVANGPAVFSLSGSARRTSLLPDGRDTLQVSAGDEYGIRAQNCVGAQR